MKRQEQREWLVRLAYEQDMNAAESFSAAALLAQHELPEENQYLRDSLDSLYQHMSEIDALMGNYLRDWTPERLRPIDRAILRVAINEMQFTRFAPVPVTINESVSLAKKYSDEKNYKFVNGVLSSLSKDMEVAAKPEESEPTEA